MELTLNIVWVVISTAIFIAVMRGARPWRFASTAAICLIALAFPIISITDDLSNDVFLAEASVKRRTSHSTNHDSRIATAVAVGILLPKTHFGLSSHGFEGRQLVLGDLCAATVTLAARAPPQRAR